MDEVANTLILNTQLLWRMVEPVPEDGMARQPAGIPNHPAWTLGHLAHSLQAIGGEIGLDTWLPENYAALFGTGSAPTVDREAYPTKSELLEKVEQGAEHVLARLEEMTEDDFGAPLPDARYRDTFPTVGHALVHILGAHFGLHIGQLSCWLRSQGIEPASEMDDRDAARDGS